MDELKQRAGEKLEALQEAARTVADNSKSRVHDVYSQLVEAVLQMRGACGGVWRHEVCVEARARAAGWAREAARRVREGAPLLTPLALYRDLRDLINDRVWRRSVLIFAMGAVVGGVAGAAAARAAGRAPLGPCARALHAHPDHSVSLVEDAPAHGPGVGEVMVRVQAFSVSRADRAALRGRGRLLRALLAVHHRVVGRGFAGVVLDVGVGVEELELGDEVWGCVAECCGGAGCELLTLSSVCVGRRPAGLSAEQAAALPWAGTGALRALARLQYCGGEARGRRVAVCGAQGPEGCALLQLLAAGGALPTALAPRSAAAELRALGAHEVVEVGPGGAWEALRARRARGGPWDAVLGGEGGLPGGQDARSLLRAGAARGSVVDVCDPPLMSDRLPAPLAPLLAAALVTARLIRWCCGLGWQPGWLQPRHRRREALDQLALAVTTHQLQPVLHQVFLPQDFESALAHACSEDTVGAVVIRFP